jgi:hypothetical protein
MLQEYMDWALKWNGTEHVYMSNFVSHFCLSNRESAMKTFKELVCLSQIPKRCQQKIREAFESFQENHEEQFWAKRVLHVNTELTAKKAACAVQDAGTQGGRSCLW